MRKLWDDCGLAPMPLLLPSPAGGAEEFMADLAAACRQLGSTRLRCSLFSARPVGIATRVALARLTSRFERLGPVGALADDCIGFLLLDRGHSSERDDDAVAASIQRQMADALAPGGLKRFVALHYWADEISGADDLVGRLEDRAFRRPAAQALSSAPRIAAAGM
jgi:hypothetical protein